MTDEFIHRHVESCSSSITFGPFICIVSWKGDLSWLQPGLHCKNSKRVWQSIATLVFYVFLLRNPWDFEKECIASHHLDVHFATFFSFAGIKSGMSMNVMHLDVDEIVSLPTRIHSVFFWFFLGLLRNLRTLKTMLRGEKESKLQ